MASSFYIVLLVVQIISAVTIIGLTLLQHGKGADMGAAFGSGSAGGVFGSSGNASFLSRMTSVAAFVFFTSTLAMAYTLSHSQTATAPAGSIMDGAEIVLPATPAAIEPKVEDVPAVTEPAPAGVDQIPAN